MMSVLRRLLGWVVVAVLTGAGAAAMPVQAGGMAAGSWHAQRSGTSQALYDVACFNALRCKAVGAGGTIRYTKDGGVTWRAQANPLQGSSTILYRIACAAPNSCYVIARPNIILVTHNGGASWTRHTLPIRVSGLTDQTCINAQSYAIRQRPALCQTGLLDIACVNAATCATVATPAGIYLTRDGGTTWTARTIPAGIPCQGDCVPANKPVSYPLAWISCLSSGLCRAGGSVFIGSHIGFANPVLRSRTVGVAWTLLNGTPSRFSPDVGACPSVQLCYGVFTTSPFISGTEVWISSDGGVSWRSKGSGSSKLRNDIACPGSLTCYTVGNQGTITLTTNGGGFSSEASPTSQDLYGITCFSPTGCMAVGNKGSIVALPMAR